MTHPDVAQAFLTAEIEALPPFGFVAISPSGQPLHTVEVTRLEQGALEVRVPGRPVPVPPLDPSLRSALISHGFRCEDPGNQTRAWTHGAPDETAAVRLVRTLLGEVFDEKPDVDLDVRHGSHRIEHEAAKKLEVARGRIERLVTEMLGHRPEQDDDLDYVLPVGEVHVNVAPRVTPDGQVVIRIVAITNVGFEVTPELGLFLARLNFGLMFGRFALDVANRSIWFDETLLGEDFRDEQLRTAIQVVASTADVWDDRLKQMFGGSTQQEVIKGRTGDSLPRIKPGEGVGQYL